ncbi:50S ribosomal protein L22 [bacterium]|nr:50S ribosomal protein L22 [bacterium]
MEIKAISKYLRISPKKMRLVADLIRRHKFTVEEAEAQLKFIRKRASDFIVKTLKSAISNAEHNFGIDKKNLFVKNIIVNEGPVLKRWRARAFGRAAPIKKRSSHLEIILETIEPVKTKKVRESKIKRDERIETPPRGENITKEPVKEELPKIKVGGHKKEIFDQRRLGKRRTKQHLEKAKMKSKGGIIKRIFRRKAV